MKSPTIRVLKAHERLIGTGWSRLEQSEKEVMQYGNEVDWLLVLKAYYTLAAYDATVSFVNQLEQSGKLRKTVC